MDLFEYILETMNYNLYTDEYLFENILTEDMITEAVDIRKLGSAIKKYVDKFLQWIFKKAKDLFKFIKSKFFKNDNQNNKKNINNKDYGNELFDKNEVNKYYKEMLQDRQERLEKYKRDGEIYNMTGYFSDGIIFSLNKVERLCRKDTVYSEYFKTISKESANEIYAHLLFLKNEGPQIMRDINVSYVMKTFGVDKTKAKEVVEDCKSRPWYDKYLENAKLIDRAFIELRKISNRSKDKMDKNVTEIQYRSYDEEEIIDDVTDCYNAIHSYHVFVINEYTEYLNKGTTDRFEIEHKQSAPRDIYRSFSAYIDHVRKSLSDGLERCDKEIEKFFKKEYKIYTFTEKVSSDSKMSPRLDEVNRMEGKFLDKLDRIKKLSIPDVKSNSNEQAAKFYGNEIRRVITMYTKVMNRMNKLCRYYEPIENDKKKEE